MSKLETMMKRRTKQERRGDNMTLAEIQTAIEGALSKRDAGKIETADLAAHVVLALQERGIIIVDYARLAGEGLPTGRKAGGKVPTGWADWRSVFDPKDG